MAQRSKFIGAPSRDELWEPQEAAKPRGPQVQILSPRPYKENLKRVLFFCEESRPKVLKLLEKYSEKDIFVFRSRNEADEYIKKLKDKLCYENNNCSD